MTRTRNWLRISSRQVNALLTFRHTVTQAVPRTASSPVTRKTLNKARENINGVARSFYSFIYFEPLFNQGSPLRTSFSFSREPWGTHGDTGTPGAVGGVRGFHVPCSRAPHLWMRTYTTTTPPAHIILRTDREFEPQVHLQVTGPTP